jgi:hypothetical protein
MGKWLLLFFALPCLSASQPLVRVHKLPSGNFRFELCEAKCETLGREEGYTRAELEPWKKFRENHASDVLPLIGLAAAVSLVIGSIAFFPLTLVSAAGAAVLGGFAYFFYHAPQTQAHMPNDVYEQFQANPELLPELKKFLMEVDTGYSDLSHDPRVLSSRVESKTQPSVKDPSSGAPTSQEAR